MKDLRERCQKLYDDLRGQLTNEEGEDISPIESFAREVRKPLIDALKNLGKCASNECGGCHIHIEQTIRSAELFDALAVEAKGDT